jgi:hypothetical protein
MVVYNVDRRCGEQVVQERAKQEEQEERYDAQAIV